MANVATVFTPADDAAEVKRIMDGEGWVLFERIVPIPLIEQLRIDIEKAYETCRTIQNRNGVNVLTDGTVHHLLGQGDSFLDLLDPLPAYDHIQNYFGGNFILNSYGGVINLPNKPSYVCNVHRDQRSYSGNLPLMLNQLIMLDDFTLANGATFLMKGGHKIPTKPSDDDFFTKSIRTVGPAGSVLLFNSNLWHAGGENKTQKVRRALTLTYTPPYLKPQLDYPRLLGYDRGPQLPERLRQVVGYNARIPSNLDEWYQPPEKRFYKPGQG